MTSIYRSAKGPSMLALSTPLELCRFLGLGPTAEQTRLMRKMAEASGTVDVAMDWPNGKFDLPWDSDAGDAIRAACLVLLWRTLKTPGSRGIVLAPSAEHKVGELGVLAMAFLDEVVRTRNEEMRAVSRLHGWNRIEFGTEAGWELRAVPCDEELARVWAPRARTVLFIGAGAADTPFVEAVKAIEAGADRETALILRLW